MFKEASHFSKHKRGALCRKSAQKLAKKHKKYLKEKESNDRKSKTTSNLYKPYQCTMCGSKFLDKVNVELHLERTHQTRQSLWLQTSKTGGIACTECDLWFVDKSQLKQHQQQQHNSISNHNISTLHASQIEPPNVQPPFAQQPMPPPPPPPPPQYYFQPLQHIQTFTSNQIHQIGPPVPSAPPQAIQQLSHQMPPPQGHPLTTFLVSHPQNPQQNSSALPLSPSPSQHQPISHPINTPHIPLSTPPPLPPPLPPPPPPGPPPPLPSAPSMPTCTQTTDSANSVKCPKTSFSSTWTTSRKNICGECGLKFVDPINLELHLQRKHPNSSITETVGLEGGLTLYKTNNNNNGIIESQVESCSSKYFFSQSFDCILCDYKASHMNSIVNHLQSSHNTNNANFINFTLSNGSDKNHSTNHSSQRDPFNFPFPDCSLKCKCDSCSKEFESQADLVRHTMKEKNILCGNCNYNSCSDTKVAFHMYSSHKECNQSPIKNNSGHKDLTVMPDSPNSSCSHVEESSGSESLTESACSLSKLASEDKLTCCLCDFYALTGASLAEHLESHGSIHVKCGKCNESSDHFIDINNHINLAHEGEITLVSITMTGSESPTVYMFMIMPNENCVSNGLYDDQDSNKESDSCLQTSKDVPNEVSLRRVSDEIYACSDCMIGFKGSSQLEAHIGCHPSFNAKEISQSTSVCSGESYLLSTDETFTSASVFPQKFDPLQHSPETIEFRCKECGFWRMTSKPVLRHIKAVHLSGHVVHSWKMKSGRIDYITIQVFTPLSHLVRS